ncbi:MAG TPA: hypothetical protein VK689_16785 [Armatimonadota bacterium]|nr:hypothetical protein [Armatimonadota bacterium]
MKLSIDPGKRQRTVVLLMAAALCSAGGVAAEIGPVGDRPAKPTVVQQSADRVKLAAGWRDEMGEPRKWGPIGAGIAPEVFVARAGIVGLRLPQAPDGFPYPYQWGGVTRRVNVDLGRYPMLVAYVSRVQDGSYAHLDVEERARDGRPIRTLRTPTLHAPGLIVLDVGREWGPQTRRMHLRLIAGGPLSGASCEYDWVGFVRREDIPRLQAQLSAREVGLKR